MVFKSATDIFFWLDQFIEHTVLINMNEYFTRQIILVLQNGRVSVQLSRDPLTIKRFLEETFLT